MVGSIEEVARRAGVSVATVSRALRGLPNVADATRERVLQVAAELEYVADPSASRLAERRTRTLGVVVSYLDTWFTSSVLAGVHARCETVGLDTALYVAPTGETRGRFFEYLPFRKRVDALVIVDVPVADEHLERLASADLPFVTVGLDTGIASAVVLDDEAVGRMVARHLIGQERDRIAVLGPCEGEGPRAVVGGLRAGHFAAALESAGGNAAVAVHHTGPTPAEAAEATWRLLSLPEPPDAVFALTDEVALSAMRTARDAGFEVPADLAVVGIDDHPLSEVFGLTTVRQTPRVLGERAADLAVAHLADPSIVPTRDVVTPHLLVRASSGGVA